MARMQVGLEFFLVWLSLSKGPLSNDIVVQGDYCPRGLLSKEVFTSEKLAQIIFSSFLLEVTTFIDYRI